VPSLPKINVPVTVSTEGVDKGLRDAERKMRASADRMSKMQPSKAAGAFKAAGQSALSLGGFGAIGGAAGALGTAGAGIAVALSPFIAAAKIMDTVATASKGAGKALEEFRRTGEQTVAMNSVILERLAGMEKMSQQAERGGFFKSFVAASADVETGQATGAVKWAKEFTEGLTIAGAGLGAFLAGKSPEQISNEMALSVANEAGAAQIQKRMREQQVIDDAGGGSSILKTIGDIMIRQDAGFKLLTQVTV
jgi:hypothetical protein